MNSAANNLTADEDYLLGHISRWGSDGYPVAKIGGRWTVAAVCGRKAEKHATKGKAVASFELFLSELRDRKAGRS